MTRGQQVMAAACGVEAATGLALLVAPSVVAKLLLGSEIAGVSIVISNITGVALIALAIACWPRVAAPGRAPYVAMIVYNLLVALLLAEAGAAGTATSALLWPVVVIHLILTVLIALAALGRGRGVAAQSG